MILVAWFANVAVAQEPPYRLQPGDRLDIWVSQQPSLNRTVVLSPDGRLSLPLAGHIEATGMTVEELEAVLDKRLQSFFKEGVDLLVTLVPSAQHLPSIYVVGDVNVPGIYPYRPEMTVLHAVSVSGGLYRTPLEARDLDRATVVQGQINQSSTELTALQLRIARYRAELNDASTIEAPSDLALPSSAQDVTDMLGREQRLLEASRDEIASRVAAQKRLDDAATSAREAIERTLETNKRRIDLATERLRAISILVDKGLQHNSARLELEADIASLEGDKNQLQGQLADADSSAVTSGAVLEAFLKQRRTQLMSEMNQAEGQINTLRTQLAENNRIMAIYQADAEASSTTVKRAVFTVVKTIGDKTTESVASETTILKPGDLIRVTYTVVPATTGSAGVGDTLSTQANP